MNVKYVRLTAYICTFLIFFIAIYDGIIIAFSNIDSSVSVWFASFGYYFVPVFGCSFLLSHFFSTRPVLGDVTSSMVWYKFIATVSVIISTLYDVLTIQFFNPNHAISSIPPLPTLAEWPIPVIFIGVVCGKYLGTMSPTQPAGERKNNVI